MRLARRRGRRRAARAVERCVRDARARDLARAAVARRRRDDEPGVIWELRAGGGRARDARRVRRRARAVAGRFGRVVPAERPERAISTGARDESVSLVRRRRHGARDSFARRGRTSGVYKAVRAHARFRARRKGERGAVHGAPGYKSDLAVLAAEVVGKDDLGRSAAGFGVLRHSVQEYE